MTELNRQYAQATKELKEKPKFDFLINKRNIIEGEIKTLYRILGNLEEME